MATDRMRALLDDLGTVKGKQLEDIRALGTTPAAAANPLGLKFLSDARVLDLATGTAGAVTRAWRDPLSGGGHYSVRLDDGRLIIRGDAELELHPAPALPFGK